MSDDDQRRRHPRIETQQHVWVEGQDVRVAAQARNMSKGGMFVVAEGQAPAIGSKLAVTFDDPHEGSIEVKMEVVWRDEKTLTSNLGLRAVDSRGMAAFERVVSRYEAELPRKPSHAERESQVPTERPSKPEG
jgi:c-di-GMP-binding flagellar brake protein YcgR